MNPEGEAPTAYRPRPPGGVEVFMILPAGDLASEIARSRITHIDKEASVLAVSKLMRESGATELLVTATTNGVFLAIGMVTASEIVTRVVAAELDPAVLTAGDITWPGFIARSFAGGR